MMTASRPVHTATVGPVTAFVYRVEGFEVSYYVTISSRGASNGDFLPEELPQVAEAARQAQMFIGLEEQIARMNWCPGCGG